MSRLTSNLGLKFAALLLAVGMVWLKGQDRINRRTLTDVPVTVENLPHFYYLPDRWISPQARVTILGARNSLELIRPDLSSFRIDLSKFAPPEDGSPLNVILTNEMFRTNLEPRDRARISILEDSIAPSQATISVAYWDLAETQPNFETADSAKIAIPLLRVRKLLAVEAPRMGTPPEGYDLKSLVIDPDKIAFTGDRAALSRIQSVSTVSLNMSLISPNTPPIFLPLERMEKGIDIHPAQENIRGVTVTLKLEKKGK
ncbi:MAG: YbbR-like domain-containing protein [Candidatus Omnitrophota bacterium]